MGAAVAPRARSRAASGATSRGSWTNPTASAKSAPAAASCGARCSCTPRHSGSRRTLSTTSRCDPRARAPSGVRRNGAYEHVDVEYARRIPPGWGRPPWAVAMVGLGALVAAVALFAAGEHTPLAAIAIVVAVAGALVFALGFLDALSHPVEHRGTVVARRVDVPRLGPWTDLAPRSRYVAARRGEWAQIRALRIFRDRFDSLQRRRRRDPARHPATRLRPRPHPPLKTRALPNRTYVRYHDNMGYRGKLREQEQARELRAQNLTLQDIADRLGVSKSSVSLWVRDVPLHPVQTPLRPPTPTEPPPRPRSWRRSPS